MDEERVTAPTSHYLTTNNDDSNFEEKTTNNNEAATEQPLQQQQQQQQQEDMQDDHPAAAPDSIRSFGAYSSRSLRGFQGFHDDNDDEDEDAVLDGDGKEKRTQDLAAEQERKTLAVRETRRIRCMKIIFIIIMVCSALLSAGGVILYSYYIEISTLAEVFQSYSTKAFESFNEAVESKLATIDSLSASITSYALHGNHTFPNVTIPNFEVIGSSARVQSDGLYIIYLPLVTKEQKLGWEAYTAEHKEHFVKSFQNELNLQGRQDIAFANRTNNNNNDIGQDGPSLPDNGNDTQGKNSTAPTLLPPQLADFSPIIQVEDDNIDGPYLPFWQSTPAIPIVSLLNLDMTTWEYATIMFPGVINRAKAVLDVLFVLDADEEKNVDDLNALNAFLALGQYRNNPDNFADDPASSLGYPVFDNFGPDRQVVGVLFTSMYWRFYLTDILPGSTDSVLCVVENSLNQTATYLVEGSKVTYLGANYTVQSEFLNFEGRQDITSYARERSGPSTRSYTAVDLDGELVSYTLRVYPSNEMYKTYVTTQPFLNGVGIIVVFIISSFLFIAYNCLVERRQRIIYDKAVKASAFVSSLYPENVKQQVIEHDNKGTAAVAGGPVQRFLGGSNDASEFKKPIADHFPEATVLFADLPGFAKWTSTREPEQVFILLETLYRAFDAIALRRNVFKVETIGDCYMAVTGVPNPQADHAIIMAFFARDCMVKTSLVIEELKDKLGDDTNELLLRVGLNSGHVTAGVLRSDKARFQLFGDTVNTASRMETKGMKGRIHCTKATADRLIQGGKGSWVVARDEKIEAKGKGLLQTYWVLVPATKSRKSSLSSSTSSMTHQMSQYQSKSSSMQWTGGQDDDEHNNNNDHETNNNNNDHETNNNNK